MLLPRPGHGVVAAQPPGTGPGYWAGAPCAVAGDGEVFLATGSGGPSPGAAVTR